VIVSHRERVLFVHVQKTGGSTVQSVLLDRLPGAEKLAGLPGAKHAHLKAALRTHPELAAYWTFGFVRNPWARLWSWWSMIDRRQDQRDQGHAWASRRIANNPFWNGVLAELPDFEAFVMRGPEQFARLRAPQLHYLRTPARRADFIGRTESLVTDLAQVCDRLGIEPPPVEPRRNADPGGSGSYRDHYTPAMRQRVAELFEPDLREFGYEF
jgi:sulfotransferase famil protein